MYEIRKVSLINWISLVVLLCHIATSGVVRGESRDDSEVKHQEEGAGEGPIFDDHAFEELEDEEEQPGVMDYLFTVMDEVSKERLRQESNYDESSPNDSKTIPIMTAEEKWIITDQRLDRLTSILGDRIVPHAAGLFRDMRIEPDCANGLLKWLFALRNRRTWAVKSKSFHQITIYHQSKNVSLMCSVGRLRTLPKRNDEWHQYVIRRL